MDASDERPSDGIACSRELSFDCALSAMRFVLRSG